MPGRVSLAPIEKALEVGRAIGAADVMATRATLQEACMI